MYIHKKEQFGLYITAMDGMFVLQMQQKRTLKIH